MLLATDEKRNATLPMRFTPEEEQTTRRLLFRGFGGAFRQRGVADGAPAGRSVGVYLLVRSGGGRSWERLVTVDDQSTACLSFSCFGRNSGRRGLATGRGGDERILEIFAMFDVATGMAKFTVHMTRSSCYLRRVQTTLRVPHESVEVELSSVHMGGI